MNCSDCPANCLNNEISTRCIFDEVTGKSLTTILSELDTTSPVETTTSISTDDITSKSLMRNKSYICSAQIVKRDFTYGISVTQNTVLFSWDFLSVLSNLPTGYKTAKIDVKTTGSSSTASNAFTSSKTASGGVSLSAANFPISVDILTRVTSPCGDIDLTSQFTIVNPAEVGTFGTKFDARDLNPQTGVINLTQQLDSLESQLSSAILKLNTYGDLITELRSEIEALKS